MVTIYRNVTVFGFWRILVKYRPDKVYDSAESLLTSMKRLLESVQILVPPIFSYSKYCKVIQNIEKNE